MEIIQAKPTDLIEILYLLRVCILDMNAKGLKHWNSAYPGTEMIQSDLAAGAIYLIKDKGVCKGMVALNDKEPEDYREIPFQSGRKKPLYLQNMAVHPNWQGAGIARQLVEFAEEFAQEKGFDCIRLDIFQPSESVRQLYEKRLFRDVSSFHTTYQKIPFVCYEKQL
jgi:GNAT superfamily N-acetyltransferase